MLVTLGACGTERTEPSRTIVVNGDVNHAAVHELKKARGREPTREELLQLHRVWIENEILYREGSKQPRKAGEAASREQVIAAALAAIDEKVRPSSVPDDELRRWFERHRAKYEQPARFDFEDATPTGTSSEAAVRELVEKLNGASNAPESVRLFQGRPESSLVQSFGPELAAALGKAQLGTWLPLRARDGWRAVRLVGRTAGSNAELSTQLPAVKKDWIDAVAAEKRSAAVQALWKSYEIELAPPFECHAEN